MQSTNRLEYLREKENKLLFSAGKYRVTKGTVSTAFRSFKGMLLGFAIANVFIKFRKPSLFFNIALFIVFLALSFMFVRHERRHYRIAGHLDALKKTGIIFIACFLVSLVSLFYLNLDTFLIVLSITMFFTSLSYSLE
ncbi:MAG: hypothetical protein V1659_01235 [Candidatus Woesearchaeota archaeon]